MIKVAYNFITITNKHINIDCKKVEAIILWGSPTNLHDV